MKKIICCTSIYLVTALIGLNELHAQKTNKLDTTGNVGIGTTGPSSLFHVAGYQQQNWLTRFTNTGTYGHNAYFGYNDGSSTTYGLFINGGRNLANQYDLAVDNKFYVMGDGNVGIGTAAPNYKLDVAGWLGLGTPAAGATLHMEGIGGSGYAWRVRTTSVAGIDFASDNGIGRVSFLDNSNVGIGTASPSVKLEVKGDLGLGTGSAGSTLRLEGVSGTTHAWRFRTTTVAGVDFASENGIGRVCFLDNGKVGIGTIAPSEALSVNGNVRAKKIIVTLNGWSDYVFEKDYELRSLESLEYFIKQNKHLPEVPSAREVKEKGISVGDNQALLLKKIEELTLYMIAQSKKIDAQQKRIQSLENKIKTK